MDPVYDEEADEVWRRMKRIADDSDRHLRWIRRIWIAVLCWWAAMWIVSISIIGYYLVRYLLWGV